jgi:hypothetical protein
MLDEEDGNASLSDKKKRMWVHKGAYTPRVESSPIQSSQTHKDAAVTLWLIYNDRRDRAYTRAESSLVQSHES